MVKRVAGGVSLLLAVIVFLLAGEGPLEGPVGLAIGVVFGSLLSVLGGVLIGKSVLEQRD
jgi:archaellum biogenesis ATPase FlaH